MYSLLLSYFFSFLGISFKADISISSVFFEPQLTNNVAVNNVISILFKMVSCIYLVNLLDLVNNNKVRRFSLIYHFLVDGNPGAFFSHSFFDMLPINFFF